MGVLNCTPDSFYDGNQLTPFKLTAKAMQMLSDGADIIDLGGESSRPGAKEVSIDEECSRVLPIIGLIREKSAALLSIDTRKAVVAKAAIAAGANWVNDISAGADPEMFKLVVESGVTYVAMHMQGKPENMQIKPYYGNVVDEVKAKLINQSQQLLTLGHPREKIIWDPGIGFGKSLAHNLDLLSHLKTFTTAGFKVMLGASRKSFMAGLSPSARNSCDRLAGSLAVIPPALRQGVELFRVHDVRETRQFIDVLTSIPEEL